jgi:hypothetical protein
MIEFFMNVSKLLMGLTCVLAPVIILLMTLAQRDRRRHSLNTVVLGQLNRRELGGLYSVSIRPRLLGGGIVSVDLWNCSRDQVRDVLEGLAERLPRTVRLEVNGLTDRGRCPERRFDPIGCSTGFYGCSVCR